MKQTFRLFQTTETDPRLAAKEFYDGVHQPEIELVVFFCSSKYDLDVLGCEIHRLFAGIQVIGCTSTGEIGPAGYQQSGLAGISFPKEYCKAVIGILDNLQQFDIPTGYAFAQSHLQHLECIAPETSPDNSFALMLIDGLSVREEIVSHTLQLGLNNIPLVGGSAGDDQRFSQTYVYHDGRFHTDSAVVAIVTTSLPFKLFRNQHLVSTDKRMVVTEADTAKRIVKEIDGMLAAEAYADAIGVNISDLTPELFAANPVVVLIDGQEYVRSIQKMNDDASLTFYCAIDEGLVLRIARCDDMTASLTNTITQIHREIGHPQAILAFDCIHRVIEATHKEITNHIEQLFIDNNTLGVCTYGEQVNGIHLNQTLIGIAIGEK
ncbi:MAG: hypothetical protein H6R01_475 [Burkholderiaceae bacterium]|nr:hypothetical protein [Burkholderiaceae bacterium]